MRAFLEIVNGEWLDEFVYLSKQPLIDMGYDIVAFDGNDIPNTLYSHNPTKEDVCIASVEATSKFFEVIGVQTPNYIGYPEQLRKFLGRNIENITFGELDQNFPYFVKPAKVVKMFTGDVVSNSKHLEYMTVFDKCKPDTELIKSDVVEFITEYRVSVSYGKIYGMKHYKGDYLQFIDVSIIKEMISAYTNCPSAYTLDVGLTIDGRTLLVEVNDYWALGSYGLDSRDYTLLCVRRMKEILKN